MRRPFSDLFHTSARIGFYYCLSVLVVKYCQNLLSRENFNWIETISDGITRVGDISREHVSLIPCAQTQSKKPQIITQTAENRLIIAFVLRNVLFSLHVCWYNTNPLIDTRNTILALLNNLDINHIIYFGITRTTNVIFNNGCIKHMFTLFYMVFCKLFDTHL